MQFTLRTEAATALLARLRAGTTAMNTDALAPLIGADDAGWAPQHFIMVRTL